MAELMSNLVKIFLKEDQVAEDPSTSADPNSPDSANPLLNQQTQPQPMAEPSAQPQPQMEPQPASPAPEEILREAESRAPRALPPIAAAPATTPEPVPSNLFQEQPAPQAQTPPTSPEPVTSPEPAHGMQPHTAMEAAHQLSQLVQRREKDPIPEASPPEATPEPELQPEPEPEPQPVQAPVQELTAEPISIRVAAPEPEEVPVAPEPEPEPALEPQPAPVAESVPEPAPSPAAPEPASAPPVMSEAVSSSLSRADCDSIRQAIQAIRQRLAFLEEAEFNEETSLMHRIGGGGRYFVNEAMQIADEHAGMLPRSFDLEGFRREARLLQEIGSISDEIRELSEKLTAAEASVGSNAFARALSVYQSAKMAGAATPMETFLSGLSATGTESGEPGA